MNFTDRAVRKQGSSRGIPPFAGGQREEILRLLRDAGPRGVSKEFLLYEKRWNPAGVRIHETEAAGHVLLDGERYVRFILVELEPLHNSPAPFRPMQTEGDLLMFDGTAQP